MLDQITTYMHRYAGFRLYRIRYVHSSSTQGIYWRDLIYLLSKFFHQQRGKLFGLVTTLEFETVTRW